MLPIILVMAVAALVVLLYRMGGSNPVNTGAPAMPGISEDTDSLPTITPPTDTMPTETNPRQNPQDRPPSETASPPAEGQGPFVGEPVSPGISPPVGSLPTIEPPTDTVPYEINPRQNPNARPTP